LAAYGKLHQIITLFKINIITAGTIPEVTKILLFSLILSVPCKIELTDRLLKSLKNEPEKIALYTDEFIPEKSAEQIITELRASSSFGKTRIIEPF